MQKDNAKSNHMIFKIFYLKCKNAKLSLKDLKLISKNRSIEGFKIMSKDELLSILDAQNQ